MVIVIIIIYSISNLLNKTQYQIIEIMASISVTLIRKTHEDFSIDTIETLKCIRLDNLNINNIDNLEVFSHIAELYLSNNEIEIIENIDFLDQLETLDLSNNKITSENLYSSIDLLPLNLKTINLSGNSCVNDENVLIALQEKWPNLNIIVGLYEGREVIDNFVNLQIKNEINFPLKIDSSDIQNYKNSNSLNKLIKKNGVNVRNGYNEKNGDDDENNGHENVENNDNSDDDGDEEGGDENEDDEDDGIPLNADEVLKALVERKCRLQSIEMYNVTTATEVCLI